MADHILQQDNHLTEDQALYSMRQGVLEYHSHNFVKAKKMLHDSLYIHHAHQNVQRASFFYLGLSHIALGEYQEAEDVFAYMGKIFQKSSDEIHVLRQLTQELRVNN